jgi:hypothetical protein
MKEEPGSSETSFITRATRRSNPEDTILHTSHIDTNKNFKNYLNLTTKAPFPKRILKNMVTKEIEKVIPSLHSKNSSGSDEISMKTQNISALYISCPLCYIFNKTVLAGKSPSHMKYSTVTPIYKKGDKNCKF